MGLLATFLVVNVGVDVPPRGRTRLREALSRDVPSGALWKCGS